MIRILDECCEDLTLTVEAHDSREQVPEEPFGVAQERAIALDTSQLPEHSQRDVFRVREPLERLVESGARVEVVVYIIRTSAPGRNMVPLQGELRCSVGGAL